MTDKPLTNADLREIVAQYEHRESLGCNLPYQHQEARLARTALADRAAFQALHEECCACLRHPDPKGKYFCEAAGRIRGWQSK